MIQMKLFEDEFKVGERVFIVSKSLAEYTPHASKGIISRICIYPNEYYPPTATDYPNAIPKIGETYYVIANWYYLKKDLKKVV